MKKKPFHNETSNDTKKRSRTTYTIKKQLKSVGMCFKDTPEPPPETNDKKLTKQWTVSGHLSLNKYFNSVLSSSVRHEARIDM